MKKLVLAFTLGLSSMMGIAQMDNPQIVMAYDFVMLDDPDNPKIGYVYKAGESALFTKLYYPEMKKYTETFLNHAKQMRSVPNHVGPLGLQAPKTLGDFPLKNITTEIKNGHFARIGSLYMDESTEESLRYDGTQFTMGEITIKNNKMSTGKDTMYRESLETGEMEMVVIDVEEEVYKKFNGGGFVEVWDFDPDKSILEKEVYYMALTHSVHDDITAEYRGQRPVFAFKTGKFQKKNTVESRMVRQGMEYNVLFNYGFRMNEDEPNEMAITSTADGYAEPSERYDFLMELLQAVKSGQLAAYDYDGIRFEKSKAQRVMPAQFFERMSLKDTVYTENLRTGQMQEVVVELNRSLSDIIGIRFFEDWYVDHENMGMYKRVNGIVLLREKVDPLTGMPLGTAPLNNTFIELRTKW